MRSDKKKNIAKVAKVALKEPLLSRDEIAKKAGVGSWTASRALSELDETGRKDPRIISITDVDLNIVEKWQEEIDRRLSNTEELKKMRTVEISQVLKESTARYSLFRWTATDDEWWLKLPAVTFEIINPNGNKENQGSTI